MASLPPEVLNGPAYAPPAGVVPNLVDPPNNNALGLAVIIICLMFSTFCVACRAYVKIFVVKKVQIVDFLGLAAYGMFVTCSWSVLEFRRISGLFVRQWNVSVLELSQILYDLYILQSLYSFAMLFIKTAILEEWIGIFAPTRRHNAFYWISRTIQALNAALYIAAIIISNLACTPRAKIWNFWLAGTCLDKRTLDLCTSSFNLCFDLCILLLPQRVIWNLQLNAKRKIGVSIIFSVGILACVGAAGRVAFTATTDYYGEATYGLSSVALFGLMEMTCVLMVFCIPVIPRIFIDSNFLVRIATSIRSWALLSRPSQTSFKTSYNTSGSHVAGLRRPFGHSSEAVHNKPSEDSQVPLPGNANAQIEMYSRQQGKDSRHEEAGILKVTEFSTGEPTGGSAPTDAELDFPHPWSGAAGSPGLPRPNRAPGTFR